MPEAPAAEDNRWEALLRITRSWRLEWHTGELLERVAREAVELLDLERGVVFLTEGGELHARQVWPEIDSDSEAALDPARAIAEQVTRNGRPLFAHDVSSSPGASGEDGDVGVVFCVPLSSGRGVLGALYVDARRSPGGLGRRDQELLEMLGLQAAAALEHMLLYRSAITDPLTGLFTHRYFQQQVDQEIRRARRLGGSVCLLLMDLDEFKELNDSRGHEAGNQFLIRLAGAIRGAVRESDVVARFGGDEFELLLPETDAEGGRLVAEKVREATLKANAPEDPRVTASLGVASYPRNAEDAQGLFFCADESLYAAKDAGRDRVKVSDHSRPAEPEPESRRGEPAAEAGRRKDSARLELPAELGRPPEIGPEAQKAADRAREQVDGHTVVRRLGAGSTGEVLLVRQPELDRPVALKRPHSANLTEEQAEAFEREARITASLRHPGVIPVHTMGTDSDGRRYYTMQPLQDLSLGNIFERRAGGDRDFLRRYTQNSLLEIVHRVAETIAYAHQEKTAHLDLNPWNVMVGAFGEVMVIDWGEVAGSSSRPGAAGAGDLTLLAGSPRYAPPERVTGREVGFPADVHSLGAMLYEVLTGTSPYLRHDTRSTLKALREGEVVPPEKAAPEAGLDPVLTELCVRSLSPSPEKRPSALEFAQRLGRYLRREAEWEVIRFGPAEHPLVAEEWETVMGGWDLRDGEWVAAADAENVLVWKPRVPGNFRFAAEGWVEERGELSLIGHGTRGEIFSTATGPPPTRGNPFLVLEQIGAFEGYCFEFGAEDNNCTKLARHGHDVMVVPAMRIEPGRRYRLEIEYQDGWLRCFVDDEQVFAYRELFPLAGSSIGFYSSGTGPRLRPLEVQRQGFALQPAMRMADDLYKHRFYQAALERYVQIADQNPHRLEGDEARLKIGLCLSAQGEAEGARKTFRSLTAGPLQPHALAEEAAVEFSGVEGTDPRRGLQVFADLLDRFPESHARVRAVGVARRAWSVWDRRIFSENLAEDQELCRQLNLLAASTYDPPMQSQLKCWLAACVFMMRLGRYREALESAQTAADRTYARRRGFNRVAYVLTAAALAAGRDDLLPLAHWNLIHVGILRTDWSTSLPMHIAVRGLFPAAAGAPAANLSEKLAADLSLRDAISLYLAAGRPDAAARLAARLGERSAPPQTDLYRTVTPLQESGREDLWKLALDFLASLNAGAIGARIPSEDRRVYADYPRLEATVSARWHLEIEGDLAAAAAALKGVAPPSPHCLFTDTFVLQVMLASLGHVKSPSVAQLSAALEKHLSGTPLDLARMFLGEKEPAPGELWPHPLWRPEWRLWLAIWLAEKGQRERALEVVTPSRDERYGLANCQPGIARLIERLKA